MGTVREHTLRNALKFGTTIEIKVTDGFHVVEWEAFCVEPPPYGSEVGAHQEDFDRAVGEAIIRQPLTQRPRTKLIFDIEIDDPFLD